MNADKIVAMFKFPIVLPTMPDMSYAKLPANFTWLGPSEPNKNDFIIVCQDTVIFVGRVLAKTFGLKSYIVIGTVSQTV